MDNHSTNGNIQNICVINKTERDNKTKNGEYKHSRNMAVEHSKKKNNDMHARLEPDTTGTFYSRVMCKPEKLKYWYNHVEADFGSICNQKQIIC